MAKRCVCDMLGCFIKYRVYKPFVDVYGNGRIDSLLCEYEDYDDYDKAQAVAFSGFAAAGVLRMDVRLYRQTNGQAELLFTRPILEMARGQ